MPRRPWPATGWRSNRATPSCSTPARAPHRGSTAPPTRPARPRRAGGGALTWALAPTGKRILLLERGGWLPREKENWSSVAVWGDKRYRNSGPWQDGDGKEFLPKQHYYVGGNTKFYGAILFRMRERDFGAVRHVDGIAPAWPLSSADWDPWYTKAEELYSVHGQRGLDPTEPPTDAGYPWPAISHEPRIEQLDA